MLHNFHIKYFFFGDTFFVTAKSNNPWGYILMKLLVSDKGSMKLYGIKSLKIFHSAFKNIC